MKSLEDVIEKCLADENFPILICDRDFNILKVNRWLQLHAPWVTVGQTLYDIFLGCNEDLRRAKEQIQKDLCYHTVRLEIELKQLDAFMLPIELSNNQVVLCSFRDPWTRPEKSAPSFLPQISDRYRAPVLDIINILSGLAAHFQNEENYKGLEGINIAMRSCYSLLNGITSLRYYYQLVNRQIEFQPAPFVLNDYLDGLCKTLQILFANINYRIEFHCDASPIIVNIDEKLFSLALFHLIANSRIYSPEGSTIRILLSRYGDSVTVQVADEGIGIPADQLQDVFEPFFVGQKKSVAENEIGLGLGLPIAKKIAELHGGRISVVSEKNKGTTMAINLPLANSNPRNLSLNSPVTKYVTDRFSDIYIIFSEICNLTFF